MRRTFAQALNSAKVNPKKEYSKLFDLFYGKDECDGKSLADLISLNFEGFYFRGTCLDLDEFDEEYGFRFVEQPQDFDIDYLVSFCEYIYNFVLHFEDRFFFGQLNKHFYLQHINKVIDALNYVQSSEDGLTIFVPRDNVALAVSELKQIPENVSHKILAYHHHSMKRDIEAKKATLIVLANQLEPQEKALSQIDNSFKSDLFYAFNNLNIRHNNVDPTDKRYHKKFVAEMDAEELEHWYDETYQMCLLAFMRLEQKNRKKKFDEVKLKIEAKE